jgi:hypothetical protein
VSRKTEAYFRNIPMKPYDLLREGLIVLVLVIVVVVVLSAVLSSPDYPTVRSQDIAQQQPLAFLKTSASILAGDSSLQDYGPPYTPDKSNAQKIAGFAPANVLGVTNRIDPPEDFILKPLSRASALSSDVGTALNTYENASPDQQQAWVAAYMSALDKATVTDAGVQIPSGDYGPVATMMQGMLDLGRSGLLEGALESDARLPFTTDFTRSLLFFQDDVYSGVADKLDMTGDQWGISHETGRYPGAWWLWPYTFLYQIRPMSTSANADLEIGVIMTGLFLVLLLVPFIPIVNRLPRWLGVHRIIWRDWYARTADRPGTTHDRRPGQSNSGSPGVAKGANQ